MASKSSERVKYEITVNVPKWLTTEKTAISNWWREGQRGNKLSSYQMPPNNVERIDRNDSWRAVLAPGASRTINWWTKRM